ncbi:PHB depolymerase family esterase [Daejeonella sp.]|uniref:alpha/beta hydrolase family esterase n=1 Tax=Daejeonella sp. TaxID=2805397 RepID=UPI00272FCF14|nr:prolyl oligopeptidase family serine peptidase [Daejeonella sp.]MDP2414597.1 prolyl oligopeptidase family serine peptidase [Daejeonella sp.]
MRKQSFLLLLILSYLSSNAQLLSDSLLIDNHYRTFHFKKPSLPNTKSSLVFILHGSGGSGKGIMKTAVKLEAKAESENILLVYPDGYKHFWNECRKTATSAANLENIDENSFFNRMIEYFISKYQISSGQVFAIGTSGGGHMAYKLATTMPARFKAITAIIASLPDTSNMDCIERKLPMPVMIINGTSDPVNPYNGGEVKISGTVFGKVRSTEQTFRYWSSLDGYKGKPKKEILPDTDPTDGKTIEKFSYKKKGNPEVVLLKVINGKHDYPNDIDVYLESWNFFKRQINFK